MRSFILTTAVLFIACSPSSPPADASTDATSDALSDAAADVAQEAASDAPSDVASDSPDDGGVCELAPVDGGACNALVPSGALVTPTCATATTAPTATGGTIHDGRYVLTSTKFYVSGQACPPLTSGKIDWVICGSSWETAQDYGSEFGLDFDANVQSPNLTLDQTCATNGTIANWTYDATPTTLVFYIPMGNTGTHVDTFTRQ